MSLTSALPGWGRALHQALIGLLIGQMAYIGWQVFVVWQPAGTFGPIFGASKEVDFEAMMIRRAYAIEGWLSLLGLALYLAVTEVLPRHLAALQAGGRP